MDNQQPTPSFDESVAQVMQTLPPPIRNYLAQGKYTMVAKTLMLRYSLRIDQAGVLEREIMLLLMGIETPDEFAASLKSDASLTNDVVRSIMTDVNQQIFVPLREEMRKAGVEVGAEQPSAPPTRRPEIPGVKPEAGPVGPPPQSPSYFHLQNKLAAPSASAHPPAAVEKQVPKLVVPSRPTEAPQGTRPGLREALAAITNAPKQLESRKLLEDHEEPHIELGVSDKVKGVSSLPIQAPTPPSLKPYPLPLTPPANLPGSLPPHPIPAGARYSPPAPASPKATQGAAPASTPLRPYAADPYREPIEEDSRK